MDDKPRALTTQQPGGSNGASPAQQRAQIAQTREEMGATIEELHGRLNPVVLKEQALEQFHEATESVKEELKERLQDAKEAVLAEIDTVKAKVNDEIVQAKAALREATIGKVENMMHGARDRVRDTSRSVKDVVVANPIPAALTGLGLAWLFIEGRRRRAPRAELREDIRMIPERIERIEPRPFDRDLVASPGGEKTTGQQVREFAQQAGERVTEATHEAASTVKGLARDAKESVSGVAHKAQDKAVELSYGARDQARRAQRRSGEIFRNNPIAIGAAMLAAGTIIGLAVPRTKTEDEWIGGTRDDVVGKAQELAHQAIGKADEAVNRIGTEDEHRTDEQFH
jgi:gas vesicle protein